MPREFYAGIEPDKIAELGLGYVHFYEMTGERKCLEAGLRCADALVKHVRPETQNIPPGRKVQKYDHGRSPGFRGTCFGSLNQ
jgi:hypothetical protein